MIVWQIEALRRLKWQLNHPRRSIMCHCLRYWRILRNARWHLPVQVFIVIKINDRYHVARAWNLLKFVFKPFKIVFIQAKEGNCPAYNTSKTNSDSFKVMSDFLDRFVPPNIRERCRDMNSRRYKLTCKRTIIWLFPPLFLNWFINWFLSLTSPLRRQLVKEFTEIWQKFKDVSPGELYQKYYETIERWKYSRSTLFRGLYSHPKDGLKVAVCINITETRMTIINADNLVKYIY